MYSALYNCSKTSQLEGENTPKRIIQWLLGGKIVTVLVPFTKPQPKNVTHKIPERKWCSRLWLRLASCGWELWPSGHSRQGAVGMWPDYHPKAGCSRSEMSAQALPKEDAAGRCAHRLKCGRRIACRKACPAESPYTKQRSWSALLREAPPWSSSQGSQGGFSGAIHFGKS